MTLGRQLAAEGLGTALLVATVVGSGIMAQRLTSDTALALLANTLPTVAILAVLITLFMPASGAQFNPAVTLVMVLRREISATTGGLYVVAQVVGALCGTLLAHAMFGLPLFQVAEHARSGPAQFLSEVVATAGLLLVILGAPNKNMIPSMVALFIGAAYWFTASTSFANPAVTIARSLTDTFSGISPADAPAFIIAQVVGALIAWAVAGWLFGRADPAVVQSGQRASLPKSSEA